LLRIRIGKGAQQNRVHDRKDCRGRADAEGQGQYGNGGKAGILSQRAGGKAQILPAGWEKRFPAGGSDFFPGGFRIAML
jgi:hypothetical protein